MNVLNDCAALTVYVDTNFLVRLRDLEDLPWGEITDAEVVEVAIAPCVVAELDRAKVDHDHQRRNRSKQALALIEQATDQPGLKIALRSTQINLSLRVCPGGRLPWQQYPDLDPASADDALVLTALSERRSTSLLVSFDHTLLIRARVAGLNARKAPTAWCSREQHDDQAMAPARLSGRSIAVVSREPTIAAEFVDEGASTRRLKFHVLHLPPLPASARRTLKDIWLHQNPGWDFSPRWAGTTTSPGTSNFNTRRSMNDLECQLHSERCDRFAEDVEAWLASLHRHVFEATRTTKASYRIRNISGVTVSNLKVRMTSIGSLLSDWDSPDCLTPPTPSAVTYMSDRDSWPTVSPYLNAAAPRHSTAFYWLERPSRAGASLTCEEFRAGESFDDHYVLRLLGDLPISGSLSLSVSASNMGMPVRIRVGVTGLVERTSWNDPRVLERLPPWMAAVLKE